MQAPQHETLYQAGVRASAGRSGQAGPPRSAAAGEAGWFTSPSTRSAYISEVNRRIDALWRDIYQSHAAPEPFRQQFAQFHRDWQQWVGNLSYAATLLPSTEEHAQRVDLQVNDWIRRFKALGGKVNIPTQSAPGSPGSQPFPWKPLLATVALVAVVGGLVYVTSTARAMGQVTP